MVKENWRGRIEGDRLPKTYFCVSGGCLVMEQGGVDVQGAEREMDCRYRGRGDGTKR